MTDADALQLPGYRHIPGHNARPDCSFLQSVASRAADQTTDASASGNIAWCYGIRLFNEHYYWESHEVLETVWSRALPNSRERHLLQLVIHLANARLKQRMQRPAAVLRLQQMAQVLCERAYTHDKTLMGIDQQQLQRVLDSLAVDGKPELIVLDFQKL